MEKKRKRRNKREMEEFNSFLQRIGVNVWTFYNWKTGRTEIPKIIKDNYSDELKKYLNE